MNRVQAVLLARLFAQKNPCDTVDEFCCESCFIGCDRYFQHLPEISVFRENESAENMENDVFRFQKMIDFLLLLLR